MSEKNEIIDNLTHGDTGTKPSPKISVIVPVYKVEKYLPECIESILAQTFTDFELILVDDGSPDNSGKICDDYAARDSRIRVFHKENGGVSSARNLGLDNARGEWIGFVDGDDLLSPIMLEGFSSFFEEKDLDLMLCGLEFFDCRTFRKKHSFSPKKREVSWCDAHTFLEFYAMGLINSPSCKLFSSRLLRKSSFCFKEGVALGEDTLFVCTVFREVRRIATIPTLGYRVRRGHESAISRFSPNAMEIFSEIVAAMEKIPGIANFEHEFESVKARAFGLVSSQMVHHDCRISLIRKIEVIKNALSLFQGAVEIGNPFFRVKTRDPFLIFLWVRCFSAIVSFKRKFLPLW